MGDGDGAWGEDRWADAARRLGELSDQLEQRDAYAAEARARRILTGLGFDEKTQDAPLSTLSGGWCVGVGVRFSFFFGRVIKHLTNHIPPRHHATCRLQENARRARAGAVHIPGTLAPGRADEPPGSPRDAVAGELPLVPRVRENRDALGHAQRGLRRVVRDGLAALGSLPEKDHDAQGRRVELSQRRGRPVQSAEQSVRRAAEEARGVEVERRPQRGEGGGEAAQGFARGRASGARAASFSSRPHVMHATSSNQTSDESHHSTSPLRVARRRSPTSTRSSFRFRLRRTTGRASPSSTRRTRSPGAPSRCTETYGSACTPRAASRSSARTAAGSPRYSAYLRDD